MREVRTLTVAAGEDGSRLDRWFKRRWPHLNHIQLNRLVRTGQVRVDGSRAKIDTKLAAGAQVRVPPIPDAPEPGEKPVLPERDVAYAKSLVLYEDEEVLALNKPCGLAVQGGTKTHKHVDRLLSAWGEGLDRPRLTHRLDRDTSGVLVLGKTPAAAARLSGAFAKRRVKKTYWALVAGQPKPAEGLMELPLVKKGVGDRELVVPADPKEFGAEPADTEFVTLSRAAGRVTWMALRPHTGRTHQLRAHMKAMGHPILGDPKYGDEASAALSEGLKLQLHARRLTIPHPSSGQLILEAPISPELKAGFARFGFDEHEAEPEPFRRRRREPTPVSFLPPAELQRRFETAQRLLAARRAPEARAMLAPVRDAAPRDPAVRQLMAQALVDSGDLQGAEVELRAALAAAPPGAKGAAPLAMQLGVLLAHAGRRADAEAALRQAVALDRRFPPATAALAEHLTAQGRASEAVRLLEPLARVRDFALAAAYGDALKAAGRKAEAVEQHRRAAEIEPANAVAWHNLAASAGDLQRFAEAEAATARARSLGLDAPETWLVRARALAGLERWDEAEAAYREAIRRRPLYAEAHRGLAQQVWMRTGDLLAAGRDLDAALRARPDAQALVIERAQLQQYAGEAEAADRTLAAAAGRPDAQPLLKGAAAQKAVRFDPDRAARYAEEAVAAAPSNDDLRRTLAEARLAQGRWADALAIAEDLLVRSPDNQGDLMLQSTAWRLGGDDRRLVRDDYDALVRARTIDAPPGWPDLPSYLRDLAAGLERLHVTHTHPVGQSLRGGTQTNANLLESDDPAVRAFPQAVDGSIRAYMAALGPGDDPVRRRNTGAYRFAGLWSVRLRGEGRHVDHIHPAGWLSSACYIQVPPAVDAGGREGWIKFGEPGAPTRPKLEAERFEKPEPGKLVLFPSYMWHGTVPFSGEHPRLTVAFDLLPA